MEKPREKESMNDNAIPAQASGSIIAAGEAFTTAIATQSENAQGVIVGDYVTQEAMGQYIAQASGGSTATVGVSTTRHPVPPPPADFTGRDLELKAIEKAVRTGKNVITIQGTAGVGKTALLLKLAEHLRPDFPEARLYLNLKADSPEPLSPEDVMRYVVRALSQHVPATSIGSELSEQYTALLKARRVLLIMDDVADSRQVLPLLPPPNCLLLLATRRRTLLTQAFNYSLSELPLDEAAQLLIRIAPRATKEAHKIAALCRGLPLALRLAGGLLAHDHLIKPEEYVSLLQTVATHQRPPVAALEISFNALAQVVQRLCRLLAIFPENFDTAAVAALWGFDERSSRDRLKELQDRGFVEWNTLTDRGRLHPLVRDFLDESLNTEERELGRRRHSRYYLGVLEQTAALQSQAREGRRIALDIFDMEWPNFAAGHEWAVANVQDDTEAALLCSAYAVAGAFGLDALRQPTERLDWLTAAVDAAKRLANERAVSVHRNNLGLALMHLGLVQEAIDNYREALELNRRFADRHNESVVLVNLGDAYRVTGHLEAALTSYEKALAAFREMDDPYGESIVLSNLGALKQLMGATEEAKDHFQHAWGIYGEIGDRLGESNILGTLGNLYLDKGDYRQAIHYYERALAIKREVSDRQGELTALRNLGLAYADLDPRRAISYLEHALSISVEMGDRRGEGSALNNLGATYISLGEYKHANEFYERALLIAEMVGDLRAKASALGNLGLIASRLGDVSRAILLYEEAIVLHRWIGDRSSESKTLSNLGSAYAAAEEAERAIETYDDALRIMRELGDLRSEAALLALVAQTYQRVSRTEQALTSYEEALALSRQVGDRAIEEEALNFLSVNYSTAGDNERAATYYKQLLDIARNKNDQARVAEILIALGSLARTANQPELAKQYWTESREIYARLQLPHEASVASLLTELEVSNRGLFSLQEIAHSYLQAAGFDLQPGPDATLLVAVPRDQFWQKNLGEPVVTKVLTGAPLDLDGVMDLVKVAHELLGKHPCHILVICDRTPTDGAWLQIGAVRDKGVKVMPVDDMTLAIGQQEGRQRGRLLEYLEDRFLGPRRDLYDRQNPISDRLNFFGREPLADRLMQMLLDGNAVALFGLRKMGKSSLLNYLRDKLPCPVALVDLQAGGELAGVYARILNDWTRSMRTKVPDLSWTPPPIRRKADPSEEFVAAVDGLLNLLEQRNVEAQLTVLVDEIELIAPQGRRHLQDYLSFTRTLRGLVQQRPGSFMLMIAGVDPAIVRTNRFSGQQNPFYSFFREEYLPPLNLDDCKQMIRNIGLQMGLEYTDEAVDFVAQVSGGHPYWARKLCSVAFRSWDGKGKINRGQLLGAARSFVEDPSTASLLDHRGLWGELTDPHLWQRPQIMANESILMSLAEAESRRKEELVQASRQSGVYNESLYELHQRSVLGQPQNELYLIQLRLFRDWIRNDKLGED